MGATAKWILYSFAETEMAFVILTSHLLGLLNIMSASKKYPNPLVINNLSLFQANIHLIENIKLFTEINKQIFFSTVERLKSGEQINIEDLNLDNQLLQTY